MNRLISARSAGAAETKTVLVEFVEGHANLMLQGWFVGVTWCSRRC